jgi:hypothetical protein
VKDDLRNALRFVGGSVRSFVNRAGVRWENEHTVVLEYGDDDQFAYTSMTKAETKAELARALRKACGRDIGVKISKCGSGAPPPDQKGLEDDPLVQRIVEQFDGIVVETRHNTEGTDKP